MHRIARRLGNSAIGRSGVVSGILAFGCALLLINPPEQSDWLMSNSAHKIMRLAPRALSGEKEYTMSKKNQKLQLADLNIQAVEKLSGYSVAIVALKKLADQYKANIAPLEEERDKLLKEYNEGKKLNTLTQVREVEIETRLTMISRDLMTKEEEYKEDKKPYNKAKKAALVMVPGSIYESYCKAWESGQDALWTVDLRNFVRACGIDTSNDTAVANFAGVMKIRCAGSKSAGAKDTTGRLLAVKGQRTFDETVMKTFIDYCVVEKRVLTRTENGEIEKVQF